MEVVLIKLGDLYNHKGSVESVVFLYINWGYDIYVLETFFAYGTDFYSLKQPLLASVPELKPTGLTSL